MASKLIVSLVCDLHDSEPVPAAQPVRFGIDGHLYQVDASPGARPGFAGSWPRSSAAPARLACCGICCPASYGRLRLGRQEPGGRAKADAVIRTRCDRIAAITPAQVRAGRSQVAAAGLRCQRHDSPRPAAWRRAVPLRSNPDVCSIRLPAAPGGGAARAMAVPRPPSGTAWTTACRCTCITCPASTWPP